MMDRSRCEFGTLDRLGAGRWHVTCKVCHPRVAWSVTVRSVFSDDVAQQLLSHLVWAHELERSEIHLDWVPDRGGAPATERGALTVDHTRSVFEVWVAERYGLIDSSAYAPALARGGVLPRGSLFLVGERGTIGGVS